jgi:hypothetical protein
MGGKENTDAKQHGGVSSAVVIGLIAVLILGGALAFIGWYSTQPHPKPIKYLLDNVRTLDQTAVTIQGTVENPLNLVLIKVYDVVDPSGRIKVVTKRGLPGSGEKIVVNGILHEVFSVAGVNMTVIMELQDTK